MSTRGGFGRGGGDIDRSYGQREDNAGSRGGFSRGGGGYAQGDRSGGFNRGAGFSRGGGNAQDDRSGGFNRGGGQGFTRGGGYNPGGNNRDDGQSQGYGRGGIQGYGRGGGGGNREFGDSQPQQPIVQSEEEKARLSEWESTEVKKPSPFAAFKKEGLIVSGGDVADNMRKAIETKINGKNTSVSEEAVPKVDASLSGSNSNQTGADVPVHKTIPEGVGHVKEALPEKVVTAQQDSSRLIPEKSVPSPVVESSKPVEEKLSSERVEPKPAEILTKHEGGVGSNCAASGTGLANLLSQDDLNQLADISAKFKSAFDALNSFCQGLRR